MGKWWPVIIVGGGPSPLTMEFGHYVADRFPRAWGIAAALVLGFLFCVALGKVAGKRG